MSKSKKTRAAEPAAPPTKAAATFGAKDDSVDPALASLFASSSGPVKVPSRVVQPTKPAAAPKNTAQEDESQSSDPEFSKHEDEDGNEESDDDDDNEEEVSEEDHETTDGVSEDDTPRIAVAAQSEAEKPRKRKRNADEDDLEQAYFKRLQREEDKETQQKQAGQDPKDVDASSDDDEDEDDEDDNDSVSESSEVEVPLRHEVFDKKLNDRDKLNRTVFLGNVSTEAIKTKHAKRTLTRHLRSVLKTPAQGKRPGKFESIRFRSTAYAAKSGPKKATYAKKELMDATTTSTNAYAVFTTEAAAEHVAKTLNGSVVLDRHLRVDHLAHPLPIDHKRCVFIGNLSFVNEETQPTDGNESRRPTAKQPADAEEGLWRTFSKCGAVESVRVVRDQETRVSKGFAYVQFKDENSVEAALLMNDKKFPPMLPRKLRVMRARKTKVKSSSRLPSGGKLPSKSSFARGRVGKPVVFEGHRASEGGGKKGKPQSLKDRKRERNKKRPDSKSAGRSVNFKRAQARNRNPGQAK
ncbi:Nucleolar protein 12 [Cladophialophora carrionii]|uniref:Nucleolar protein 12 n=1 Tax=Cladophialophora carrionii TaxID=86049 RepID=A0A1C1CLA2_9EURO|nr:Nucleolar protein 12 [Cladophialophora carrionii]